MKSSLIPFLLLAIPCYANAQEPKIGDDILFKGVTKQSTDYSCGAAALSTLITGLVENSKVSEKDVIEEIVKLAHERESKGYTLIDLMEVSKKMGHYAEWRKVPVNQLPKISLPVILLIGLNSKFPHFVVLKGIADEQAFLADSIRGNIRIPYKTLTEEGITEKYKDWFVMAIEPSANPPKDSTLYLTQDKFSSHFTVEQSSAITLSTLPKANQLFVSYDFSGSVGSKKDILPLDADIKLPAAVDSNRYTHGLNIRYGIAENTEVTGRISFIDESQTIKFDDSEHANIGNRIVNLKKLGLDRVQISSSYKEYELGVNRRFALDDAGRTGINAGISGSIREPTSIWGTSFNAMGYTNTSYAQFILGGSITKYFSTIESISKILPEFATAGFISVNKPLADKYLTSLTFKTVNAHDKKSAETQTDPRLSVSSGITYVLHKYFQITPSFEYSFNNGENFIMGASFAYVGSW